MFTMSNNGFITMNRGDSAKFPLFLNIGTKTRPVRYEIKYHPGDVIYFGVMECNKPFEQSIIRKIYNHESPMTREGDVIVEFKSTDTEFLKAGKYYYQVKLVHMNKGEECIETVIPSTEFFIVE